MACASHLAEQWRQKQFQVDELRGQYGKVNKEVAMKKKAKEECDDLIAKAKVRH